MAEGDSAQCCTLEKQAKYRLDDKRWGTLDVSDVLLSADIAKSVILQLSI